MAHPWRMARRRTAVALYLCLDLSHYGPDVCHLPDRLRKLSPGPIHLARRSRSLADGPSLFFIRQKTRGDRTLQSAAETGLYLVHFFWRSSDADRARAV